MTTRRWLGCLTVLLCLTAGCGPTDTVTIQGCGATLPSPLYERWFLEFYLMHPNVRVNYQAVGSSAGVKQFEEGLVDLGATDESLDKKKLEALAKKRGSEVIQIPMTAGSIALCHNIPDYPEKADFNLSRQALIDILLGDLVYWDDPRIQSANSVKLPHLEIAFISRAEGSGTTFVFTNYLNAIAPIWRTDSKDPRWNDKGGPGKGKTIQWPKKLVDSRRLIGGKGNAGVAALIQQTPGALGYIETGYAEMTDMPIAALENHEKKFVKPTADYCKAALEKAKADPVAIALPAADPEGDKVYPIVTFTWIIVCRNYPDPQVTQRLKEVLGYCLESKEAKKGQQLSEQLGYIPLPDAILEKARAEVATLGTR
jgi:phosphate transport system substrate-binding protein